MASQTAAVDGSEKQVDQGGRQPLLKDAAVTKVRQVAESSNCAQQVAPHQGAQHVCLYLPSTTQSPSRAGHVFRTVIVIFGASLVALLRCRDTPQQPRRVTRLPNAAALTVF